MSAGTTPLPCPFYRAKGQEIIDQDGRQIAVVVAANCTKKLAREMAAYAAQQANHDARRKVRADALLAWNTRVK